MPGFLQKAKSFFIPSSDKRGAGTLETLVVAAVSIAAIVMIGLYLLAQLAVTTTPIANSLDANSKAAYTTSSQSLFSMFSTIVPIVAVVITITLLAIALAVILTAVRSNGGNGGYGNGGMQI